MIGIHKIPSSDWPIHHVFCHVYYGYKNNNLGNIRITINLLKIKKKEIDSTVKYYTKHRYGAGNAKKKLNYL